jgi:putative oxidoreductase
MPSQTQTLDHDSRSLTGPQPPSVTPTDVGLLALRLVLAVTLAAHGTQKLFGWFGGGGIDGTAQFFKANGYPAATAMATVAGIIETGGGVALGLGLLTPLAGAAVLGNMVNAIAVTSGGGFFSPDGIELPLLLACAAGALALSGPGRFSVDRFLPILRRHRLSHGAGALAVSLVTAAVFLSVRS